MELEKTSVLQKYLPIVHTIAQLKGRRLRMARALTGFSRQELYEKIGIATSTIDTWESGRVELTEKSAARVCASLKQVGIYCSTEWLLTGEGTPPRIMDELEKSMLASQNIETLSQVETLIGAKDKKIPSFLSEDIRRELSFFLSLHHRSMFHIVDKDFLNSRYKIGDCVAGIENNIQNLVGKVIIGVVSDGKTVFGRLLTYSNEQCALFLSMEQPNETITITGAYEVVWHRMIKHLT